MRNAKTPNHERRALFSRRDTISGFAATTALASCTTFDPSKPGLATASPISSKREPLGLSRFTCNLEGWWRSDPLDVRIQKAAQAGFNTAEMWGLSDGERDPARLRRVSEDAGLKIIHCTVDISNLAGNSLEISRDEALRSLDKIGRLGATFGTVVAHSNVSGMSTEDMLKAYADNLGEIAPMFEAANVIACIEPFNPFDHPGHFLYGAGDAVGICRAIGSPHVKLNWDLFHMQRYEGNVVHYLREGIDQCGLLQIADSPDRHEPGTGEMNYAYILSEALRLGFDGPIGLECFPLDGTEDIALERVKTLATNINAMMAQ